MAIMTEWTEHKSVPYREEWTGRVLSCKPTAYAPYNRAFLVTPRAYVGSPNAAVSCLVVNCCDSVDAKATYYTQLGLDPSTQYTDVQVYEPASVKASVPLKAKMSETLPARATL